MQQSSLPSQKQLRWDHWISSNFSNKWANLVKSSVAKIVQERMGTSSSDSSISIANWAHLGSRQITRMQRMAESGHSQRLTETFRLTGRGNFRQVHGLVSTIHRVYWQAPPEVQKMAGWVKASRTQASKCGKSPTMQVTQTAVKLALDKKGHRARSNRRNSTSQGRMARLDAASRLNRIDRMESSKSIRMTSRPQLQALC